MSDMETLLLAGGLFLYITSFSVGIALFSPFSQLEYYSRHI